MTTTSDQLQELIAAYNEASNAHDVERIGSMHAPDMVFENHAAGERAEGEDALEHIARIFESWPDISFETRRLYVHEDLVVQERERAAETAEAPGDPTVERYEVISAS